MNVNIPRENLTYVRTVYERDSLSRQQYTMKRLFLLNIGDVYETCAISTLVIILKATPR